METTSMIIDGRHCAAWRVSAGRWHASAYTRSGSAMVGSGATAEDAAAYAARLARTLDDGSRAEKEALVEQLLHDVADLRAGEAREGVGDAGP